MNWNQDNEALEAAVWAVAEGTASSDQLALLDASPATSLPLSYFVEILTERDAQLLDDLRALVDNKRRELRGRENEPGSRESGVPEKD